MDQMALNTNDVLILFSSLPYLLGIKYNLCSLQSTLPTSPHGQTSHALQRSKEYLDFVVRYSLLFSKSLHQSLKRSPSAICWLSCRMLLQWYGQRRLSVRREPCNGWGNAARISLREATLDTRRYFSHCLSNDPRQLWLIRTSFKKPIKGLNSATHGVVAFVELPNHRILPIIDFGAREIMAVVDSLDQVFFIDSRKTTPYYTGKEDAQDDRKKNGRKNG